MSLHGPKIKDELNFFLLVLPIWTDEVSDPNTDTGSGTIRYRYANTRFFL